MDSRIIEAKLKSIRQSFITHSWPVETWETRLGTHLAPEQYRFDADWQNVTGESLWPAGKTLFLRQKTRTPQGAPAEEVYLKVDAEGLEGLLSVMEPLTAGSTQTTRSWPSLCRASWT